MFGLAEFVRKTVNEVLDERKIDLVENYVAGLDEDCFYLIVLPTDFSTREADRIRDHLERNNIRCLVAVARKFRLVELGD